MGSPQGPRSPRRRAHHWEAPCVGTAFAWTPLLALGGFGDFSDSGGVRSSGLLSPAASVDGSVMKTEQAGTPRHGNPQEALECRHWYFWYLIRVKRAECLLSVVTVGPTMKAICSPFPSPRTSFIRHQLPVVDSTVPPRFSPKL